MAIAGQPVQAAPVDSAQLLVEYQTIMACLSDRPLASVHEGLQLPPDMPLHAFAAFDDERLLRISRWKSMPGNTKEIIRCYVKVVLALTDLARVSKGMDVQRPPSVAKAKTAAAVAPQPALTLPPSTLERAGGTAPPRPAWRAEAPSLSSLMPRCGALPARCWTVVLSWTNAAHWTTDFLLLLAAWVPVLAIFIGLIILVCDPTLLFSLLWRAVAGIPRFVRSQLQESPPQPTVFQMQNSSSLAANYAPQMYFEPAPMSVPQFAHPSYALPTQDWTLLYMNFEMGALGTGYLLLRHFKLV